MRRLLWLIIFFVGYVWLVTSGREDLVLETGKTLYRALITWFDDAQVDFHLKKEKIRKKSRRWD